MPQDIQQRIIQALESLADDALWYRRVKKLQGTENQYRLRIGRWRVLFHIDSRPTNQLLSYCDFQIWATAL